MSGRPKPLTNWVAIEGLYRAGARALRDIGDEFGVTEGAIRKHAKRHGWMRDAANTKREIVRQVMSGTQDGTQGGTQSVLEAIEEAASEDIADMRRGLRIQRYCLMSLEQAAENVREPREVKVIVEAAGAAIDSIRRIRGLDQELRELTGADTDVEDDARADEIAQRLVKRVARGSIGRIEAAPAAGVVVAPVGS